MRALFREGGSGSVVSAAIVDAFSFHAMVVCSCECARKVLIQRVEERARESVDDDDALSCIFMISCAAYFLKLVFTFSALSFSHCKCKKQ